MNQSNDQKIICNVCGSVIKNNKKNILQHEKTVRHQKMLKGEEVKEVNKKQAERQAEYRTRLKAKLGEEQFKEMQKIQKQRERKNKKVEEKEEEKVEEIVKNANKIINKNCDEKEEAKELVKKLNNLIKKCDEKSDEEVKEDPKVELNSNCLSLVENMYQAGKKYAEDKGDMDVKIDGKKAFVSKKSIMQYHKTIHKWYKRYYKTELIDCSNLDWLKRDLNKFVAFVMRYVKEHSKDPKNFQNSLTSNVNDITGYLKRLKGYDNEYKKISALLKVNVDKRQKLLDTNEPTLKQQERLISYDKLKSYKDVKNGTSKQRLLYALYTFFVRRIQDYRLMKIYKMKKKDSLTKVKAKLDKGYNYIIVGITNDPHTFVFNNYKKTVYDKLGQQSFQIPAEIKPFIVEYVQDNDIKSGDLLFTKQDGSLQSDPVFSAEVSNAFKEITGTTLSINDLRHIVAGYYINKRPAMSKTELTEQAFKMAQSNYDTLYSYYKKNEVDE